ncbi:MAG TPA: CHAT domain-containing protein [Saprospiraceae bacterium]|nr:CHAT domain-containing protein [Saprospiraceae bacterium]HNT20018.1 CHAT domain-containing protein [Saprospiraceae bacterium]
MSHPFVDRVCNHESSLITGMRYFFLLLFFQLATVHSRVPAKKTAEIKPGPDFSIAEDSIRASTLFQHADSALFNLQYDSAIIYFEKSANQYQRIVDSTRDSLIWAGYANALFSIGFCHQVNRDMKKGLEYLQQSLKVVLERFGEDHPTAAWTYFKMARSYLAMGDGNAERSCTLKGFNICQRISGKYDFLLGQAYHEMGYQYFLLNDQKKIEIYFNKTEQIYDSALARYGGGPAGSESYPFPTKPVHADGPQPNSVLADFPLNFAEFHLRKSSHNLAPEKLNVARYSFNKAWTCYNSYPYLKPRLRFRINHIRAYLLINEQKIPEALSIAEELIELTKNNNNKYIFIDAFETKALALEKSGRFDQAFHVMKKCFTNYRPEGDLGIVWYMHRRMADLSLSSERYPACLNYCDSLMALILKSGHGNLTENVNWKDYSLHEVQVLIQVFKYRYAAFSKWKKNRLSLDELKQLQLLFKKIHEATIYLHSVVYTDEKRLALEADHYPFYEKAIEFNEILFDSTREAKYALNALTWSESSKNVLWSIRLLEQQKGNRYYHSNTINKIKSISRKIRDTEYTLTEMNINPESSASKRKSELQSALASHSTEMELLKAQYSREVISFASAAIHSEYPLAAIQNRLKMEHSVLLDYFYGDSLIALNLVSPDTAITHILPGNEELSNSILNYLSAIKAPGIISSDSLRALSQNLLQILIKPVWEYLNAPNLVIIPDGPLNMIPFEMLLEGRKTAQSVRYEYSSGDLLNENPVRPCTKYIGFAPEYSGLESIQYTHHDSLLLAGFYERNRSSLGPLRFNREEVKESAEILKGKVFSGNQVSREVFNRASEQAGILHLALHALEDEEHPEYSQFLLNSESGANAIDPLYSFQIKNLFLKADLAILSACNTGVGKYQRGNGVQSLAKAFKQAGCNNILMSLWPVNDASTKEIVVGFIKNLKNGLGKADALAKAKQNYLAAAPEEMKHPYYWAGLVLIGDNEPMFGSGVDWPVSSGWLIILLLVVSVFFVVWRRKWIN